MGTRDERDASPDTPSASEENPSNAGASPPKAQGQSRRSSTFPAHTLPSTLAEAIEAEREQLLQVQAMARCLYQVLLSRFVDADVKHSRGEAVVSLQLLESRLQSSSNLFGNRVALADMAIAPFVRQFSKVDPSWFASQPLPNVMRWLATILDSPRFVRIVRPRPSSGDLSMAN